MKKIFFTDDIEWSSKNVWKMIYLLNVKLIKTTRNKRSGGSILHIFIRYMCKTGNTI